MFFERRYLKKRFRPSPAMALFLRVYSPEVIAEYPVTNRKGPVKPLKIRPSAIKHIDIVLRRSAGPGFRRPPDDILVLVPRRLFLHLCKKGRPPMGPILTTHIL
jgi:hypothetical protein